MKSIFDAAWCGKWKRARIVALPLVLVGAVLAGCSTSLPGGMFGKSEEGPIQTQPQPGGLGGIQSQPLAGPTARVGLILPLSAGGNAGMVAVSMKNAADLALAEFGTTNIQLIVKDDHGSAQGARAAAEALVQEGAEIILGPLFSPAVAAAGPVAKQANIPMIAFSTDTNVATQGVYLLSFLPESDVDRIVSYSAQAGKRSIVALLPENAYGAVVDAQLRSVATSRGARVVAVQKYHADGKNLKDAAKRAVHAARQAETILIADSPEMTPQVVSALAAAGLKPDSKQLIGTGLWDDKKLFADPKMNGAWFAATETAGYNAFAQRYHARFGQDPVRTSSLAYDAVSLVAALLKTHAEGRFSVETLTNPSGFVGVDGIFRFRRDGTSERGLAVMEIRDGGTKAISAAPRAFTGYAASN
jgi:ABC-type branched-subunit amino acid transport system substrate-binding protein